MVDYRVAAALFSDRVEKEYWFETEALREARRQLDALNEERSCEPIFLLGAPGTGKSSLLAALNESMQTKGYRVVFFSEPFFSQKDFFIRILDEVGVHGIENIHKLREAALAHYENIDHLVIIDEAQLASMEILEFLRTLSDTGKIRILFAMHLREGEALLRRPHFRARRHRCITLQPLDRKDTERFIVDRLQYANLKDASRLFDKKTAKFIHLYSKGNFRLIKRMAEKILLLLDEVETTGYRPLKPKRRKEGASRCLIDMAALDLGLLHA